MPILSPSFETCFLNMYQAGQTPDAAMQAEREGVIDRYVGEGEEPFYYSLRLHSPCNRQAFAALVKEEIALAKRRNRYFFEWKEFDFPSMPFVPEILTRHGFQIARESRLLYAPAMPIEAPSGVTVRPVETDADFEVLLDVNEAAFGERSEWLNRSLRPEIKSGSKLVRAFVAYVNEKPACSAWIKVYSKIGFLFGGGTVPALRGKGAYRALVNARSEFAQGAGVEFLLSECTPFSEKILRSLQFIDGGKAVQWVHASA